MAEHRIYCKFCHTHGPRFNCVDCYYLNSANKLGKLINEYDPNGKTPHEPGAKLDAGKVACYRGCIAYFPRAIRAVANVSTIGARKYAWKGWESVPDGVDRYRDALVRHLVADVVEGPVDKDTGVLHAAQVAWNALATLELILREKQT